MSKFQLIIKIPFEALDAPDARQKAKEMLYLMPTHLFSNEVQNKLQQIHDNKPPEGVQL
jgi:hypothetical protein